LGLLCAWPYPKNTPKNTKDAAMTDTTPKQPAAHNATNPTAVHSAREQTLNAILELLKTHVAAPKLPEAQTFTRILLARTPVEELSEKPASAWAGMAVSLLKYWRERRGNEIKVRVYNPNIDAHGWESSRTVVEVVNDDMPFLVDSAGIAIQKSALLSHLIIHPVLSANRDAGGNLLSFDAASLDQAAKQAGKKNESIMHFQLERVTEVEALETLRLAVEHALSEVRACVTDFSAMRDKAFAIAADFPARKTPHDAEDVVEAAEFLRWIANDHFTLLGYREYNAALDGGREVLKAVPGSGLGILRADETKLNARPTAALAARDLPKGDKAELIVLSKTNARSTVHHPGYMDYVGVLTFDAAGQAVSEQRFLGMYTSSALSTHPWQIPLLRKKITEVQTRSGLNPAGHSGKALLHVLESLPRDELFQASAAELTELAIGILNLQERSRTKLFVRRDRFGRSISCLAFIPRERFTADIRERVEQMLKRALHGERLDSSVHVSESVLARLHVVVRPKAGEKPAIELADLEAKLRHIVRNWQDELREILVQKHGEDKGIKLANKYGKALPAGYIEDITPFVAASDVENAAALKSVNDIRLSLYRSRKKSEGTLRFKLFKFGHTIALSDALPLLENMGLRVLSEHPYEMAMAAKDSAAQNVWIQEFDVEPTNPQALDVETLREPFAQAFEQAWRGTLENDGFNKLVLAAGLSARQVSVLRAYCKYLLQTKLNFSQSYIERAMNAHPLIARLLIELFEAKFDPAREAKAAEHKKALKHDLDALISEAQSKAHPGLVSGLLAESGAPRLKQMDAAAAVIHTLLNDVQSLDEDRILRAFVQLISATLRTNAYQKDDGALKGYMSFKLESARVPELPKPVPYREIFVYSPRVEGVHLRFGKVARGGLRWSDRREDFRTEVLGLVKAQQVKNTVIVPVGAKGGFYVKRPAPASDRDAVLAEGIACYRLFISGLLDITDNVVAGKIVYPDDVVRHDEDDPYLVVAADKGTATFSDIANALSKDYGFWLGDAFASGGSNGYDHKKMGITAKGGWESVKRHFRALDIDCQTQEFSCVGVGDMSGDVFGNGMLLSRKIKLFAAFDHRHIFMDPTPECEASFIERERMFNLPRSSWDDYNKSLISAGGGVYSRASKSIPVSAQMQRVLDVTANTMSPNELMQAILRAPVALLWNGGIGTYVKASSESHADVGDRANNAIRLDGKELRCKMVGEGGNLGMTQLGRVEFALRGGLLNTDFIDNSAGVDTSDHEVNIKILLNEAVSAGELPADQRDPLLLAMTDEVGEMVITDNYRQNLAISVMQAFGIGRIGAKQHFIRTLESQGLLDRGIEYLPSDEEFAERKARKTGLTRPELSTLLSYAKLVLYAQLLDSDVPEDAYLSRELALYFPAQLREKFAATMQRHRLKREIIATQITNSVVNRMGSTFFLRMQEDTGATPAKVAKAFTIAREVTNARSWWADLDALNAKVPGQAQMDAHLKIWNLLRNLTRWLLNLPGGMSDIAALVSKYSAGASELQGVLSKVLPQTQLKRIAEEEKELLDIGFGAKLAATIAGLNPLSASFDVIEVASLHKCNVERAAKVYFDLGDALHLKWLQDQIEKLPVEGRWHANARGVMRDELYAQHRALANQLLTQANGKAEGAIVADWLAGKGSSELSYTLSMFNEMRASATMDYATMSVAIRRLAQLVSAGLR
jgi:glutamate dehydrogenase